MTTLIIESNKINLPKIVAKKFKGKKIKILETNNGILLTPLENPIKVAHGILKDSRFNLKSYRKMKQENKKLEK